MEEVFSDVVEDFSSLHEIKLRLEQWKFGSPKSYQQAYVSLCLPRLLVPLVRHQLLLWNPLEVMVACSSVCGFMTELLVLAITNVGNRFCDD